MSGSLDHGQRLSTHFLSFSLNWMTWPHQDKCKIHPIPTPAELKSWRSGCGRGDWVTHTSHQAFQDASAGELRWTGIYMLSLKVNQLESTKFSLSRDQKWSVFPFLSSLVLQALYWPVSHIGIFRRQFQPPAGSRPQRVFFLFFCFSSQSTFKIYPTSQ